MPSRSAEPLLSEWEDLIYGFDVNRRWRVTPLLRWFSKQGIAPGDVKLSDLFEYRDAILDDRLRDKPETTWDSLIWTWNLCMREVPGWPQVEIERVSRRETYALPWSAFPKTFKQDVDRFLDRLSGRDLSEDGPARPARPVTLETRARQLRLAASALVLRGHAPETITRIADLLTLERYREILRFFIDRNGHESMTFGDWLRNAWRVARAQRAIATAESMGCPAIKLIALQLWQENAATPEVRARRS